MFGQVIIIPDRSLQDLLGSPWNVVLTQLSGQQEEMLGLLKLTQQQEKLFARLWHEEKGLL